MDKHPLEGWEMDSTSAGGLGDDQPPLECWEMYQHPLEGWEMDKPPLEEGWEMDQPQLEGW